MRCYHFLRSTMMALLGGAAIALGAQAAQWDDYAAYPPAAAAEDVSEQPTYFDDGPVTDQTNYLDEYSSWNDQTDSYQWESTWEDPSSDEADRFEYPEEEAIADTPEAEAGYYEEEYYYKYGYEYAMPESEPAAEQTEQAAAMADSAEEDADDSFADYSELTEEAADSWYDDSYQEDSHASEMYGFEDNYDYGYEEQADLADDTTEQAPADQWQSEVSEAADEGADALAADPYNEEAYSPSYGDSADMAGEADAGYDTADYGPSYETDYGYYGYQSDIDAEQQDAEDGSQPDEAPADLIETDSWAPQADEADAVYNDPSRWEGEFDLADQEELADQAEVPADEQADSAADPYFDGYDYDGYDYRGFEQASQEDAEEASYPAEEYDPYADAYGDAYEADPYDEAGTWDDAEPATDEQAALDVSDSAAASEDQPSADDTYEYAWPEEAYAYPVEASDEVNSMEEPASQVGDDSQWDDSLYSGYSEAYPEPENAYPEDEYADESDGYGESQCEANAMDTEPCEMGYADENIDDEPYDYESAYDYAEPYGADGDYADEYADDGSYDTEPLDTEEDTTFGMNDQDEMIYSDGYDDSAWEESDEPWWSESGDSAEADMPSESEQSNVERQAEVSTEAETALSESSGDEAWRWWENYYEDSADQQAEETAMQSEAAAPMQLEGEPGEPYWEEESADLFEQAEPYDPYGAQYDEMMFDESASSESETGIDSMDAFSGSAVEEQFMESESDFAGQTAESFMGDVPADEASQSAVPSGVQLFASDPADLLTDEDEQLLRRIDGLWEEPEGVRRAALNDYLESLGWEAVELAGRFEQVTGIDALDLSNDLAGAAALLAGYRLVERGELTLDEAVEVLRSSLHNLPLSWVHGVRRITRSSLDQVRTTVEQLLHQQALVAPQTATMQIIAVAVSRSVVKVGHMVVDTARRAAKGQWTGLLLDATLSSAHAEVSTGMLQR